MIFSLYRILLGVLVLIAISGFLSLTSSEYGPTLRGHMSNLNPFPGNVPSDSTFKLENDLEGGKGNSWNLDDGQPFTQDLVPEVKHDSSPFAEDEHLSLFDASLEETPTVDMSSPPDVEMPKGWGDDDYPNAGDDEEDEGEYSQEDSYPQEEGYPQMDGYSKDIEETNEDDVLKEVIFDPENPDAPAPAIEPWQTEVLDAMEQEPPAEPEDKEERPTGETNSTESGTTSTAVADPRFIFAFGDSLTALGFSMEGEKPSHGNPFGNPPFPGHTSAGGPNWLDDLILASPEDTMCYNFATGAAVVDIHVVAPMLSLIPFPYQVVNFTSKLAVNPHPSFANWTSDNSLAIIWLGVNDVSVMQVYTNNATPTNLTDRIMVSFFEKIGVLHEAGLKRFLFMGVPPLYKFPFSIKEDGPYEHYDNLTFSCHYWNDALESSVQEFKRAHSDVTADVLLVDNYFNQVIDNPRDYGALNATCKAEDGTSCLWVDGLHPGVEIARKVAAGVHDFVDQSGFYD